METLQQNICYIYIYMYINVPPHLVNQPTIPVLPPEYQETENGEQFFVAS